MLHQSNCQSCPERCGLLALAFQLDEATIDAETAVGSAMLTAHLANLALRGEQPAYRLPGGETVEDLLDQPRELPTPGQDEAEPGAFGASVRAHMEVALLKARTAYTRQNGPRDAQQAEGMASDMVDYCHNKGPLQVGDESLCMSEIAPAARRLLGELTAKHLGHLKPPATE